MIFKDELSRLARSSMVYGCGRILNRALAFLLLPVFTAYLSPGDYGVLAMLAIFSLILTSVFSLGFGMALGVAYFDGDSAERKQATIWTALLVLVASAALMCAGGFLFSRPLGEAALKDANLSYLVTLTLVNCSFSVLLVPLQLYLQFEQRAKLFVVLTLLASIVTVGSQVWFVVILRRGVDGMVIGQLISQALTLLTFLIVTWKNLPFRTTRALSRELLRLGVPLIPCFAFFFILQQGNKLILQWYEGMDALGVYNIGFSIGFAMNVVAEGFANAWIPYFLSFTERKDEAVELFGRILTYYVFAFGLLSICFFLFARPVILIMTEPAFHSAYRVIGLVATSNYLMGIFAVLLPGIYFAKEVKFQTLVQAIAASISVGMGFLLIPWLGVEGAALGLLIGFLAMPLTLHVWNQLRGYQKFRYEWRRVFSFLVSYTLIATPFTFERDFSLAAELTISVVSLILVLGLLFCFLTSGERIALRRILQREPERRPSEVGS